MSNKIFTFGPTGRSVALDPSGRLMTVTSPPGGSMVFGYGDTGNPLLVDDQGRLLITLQSPSGTTLPDPAAYGFGDRFYLIGGAEPGFYIRGISNWEYASATAPSGVGDITTAENVGAGGVGVFSAKAADTLQFHTLGAGSGIKLTLASEKITIDNKVTRALDMSIADAGSYYATHNVESALQTAGLKNKNFTNASGNMVAATTAAQVKADGVRTDFDNASGVMNAAIALATKNTTDFVNSSGIFQAKVATITSAGGTSIVKAATGVLKGLTAGTGVTLTGGTNAVTIDVKDFANASGAFVKSAASAGGTSMVKTGTAPALSIKGLAAGTGVTLTAETNDVKIDVKDFANASGFFVKSLASAGGATMVKTGTAPALAIKGLTAVSGLGLIMGTNAVTVGLHIPSGKGKPNTNVFADMYYHEVSGFMMRAQDHWDKISVDRMLWAKEWFDGSPGTGPTIALTNAGQYYKVTNFVPASGDSVGDLSAMAFTSSGIKITKSSAEGYYQISAQVTMNGTNNKNIWMSLFHGEQRIKSSTIGARGTGQIFSNFANTIYPISKDKVINLRFMCDTTGCSVRIDTVNIHITRIQKTSR